MEKLANLESRLEDIKREEASKSSFLDSLRLRKRPEKEEKTMIIDTWEGEETVPLVSQSRQKLSSISSSSDSLPETPVSSPEPYGEHDSKPERALPGFLRDTWLDRHHRLVFISVELMFWATLFYIFVLLEFGFVYLTLSIFYLIWRNTSTRRKKREGELSAYSVFNPNCEPIHGTVSPTQLTRELGLAAPIYT